MIKINLGNRKQSSVTSYSRGGGGGGGGGASMEAGMERLRELPIRKLIAPVAICFIIYFGVDEMKSSQIKSVDASLVKGHAVAAQLKAELEKSKGYESLKNALEGDGSTIKAKLDTIQKLLEDRTAPPKLLLALSGAIPKEVWLSEFNFRGTEISIRGYAKDFNQVPDFLKTLAEDHHFQDLELRDSKQTKDETGLEFSQFELASKRGAGR